AGVRLRAVQPRLGAGEGLRRRLLDAPLSAPIGTNRHDTASQRSTFAVNRLADFCGWRMDTTSVLTTSHWIPDGSGPPLLADATVGGRLREVAAEMPDRVALVEGLPTADRRQWTYAELLEDAERCARYLLQHFAPGEHIAVWAHNLPEWVL